MEKKWRETYKVGFRDVDFKEELKLSALVEYMQELAGTHANHLQIDFSHQEGHNWGWLVLRSFVEIEAYPKYGESFILETYPDGLDGIYAVRQFKLYTLEGKQIGQIIGYYVLMDFDTKRPVRMQQYPELFEIFNYKYEGKKLPKLINSKDIEIIDYRKACYSEIDIFRHMNNTQYYRWVLDAFPIEMFEAYNVHSIQINYVNSVQPNEVVKVLKGQIGPLEWTVEGLSESGEVTHWIAKVIFVPRN